MILDNSDLRIAFLQGNPSTERPADWPGTLYWTPEWSRFLEPEKRAVYSIYGDEVASQANDFEADAVAAILRLLSGGLDRQLAGKLNESGGTRRTRARDHLLVTSGDSPSEFLDDLRA